MLQVEANTILPTEFGTFQAYAFPEGDACHMCLVHGELDTTKPVLVRFHSKCTTGDVFGSQRCDCRPQLVEAIRQIKEAGSGIIVYLDQEGRGIGLLEKLKAYELQEKQGLDTVDANLALGHPIDARSYELAVEMLRWLGVSQVTLLTNNPRKLAALQVAGFEVTRQEVFTGTSPYNAGYLATKRTRLDHQLPAMLEVAPRHADDKVEDAACC